MIRGLATVQSRVFAALIVIVLLTLGGVYLFLRRAVDTELDAHERRVEHLEMTRMAHWITGYYNIHDGWEGLQPYVDEMAVLFGNRIVVVDTGGDVVADSRTDPSDPAVEPSWPNRPLRYDDDDPAVGTLYVGSEMTIGDAFRSRLKRSIRSYLLVAMAVAVAAAASLSAVASGRLAAPVKALADSAARAGAGDLSVRIDLRERGELAKVAAAFNTMIGQLDRAATMRRHLVADTAHELRTPLSNIRGYAEALRDGVMPASESLPVIEEEVSLLVRLVDDLQDLALAESGVLRLRPEQIDPVRAVARSIAAVRPAVDDRAARVIERLAPSPPIVADPDRFQQIMLNILKNAITVTPDDGAITVELIPGPTSVTIAVRDQGPGIAPEERERIFSRFYRVDGSRSRATGGSGLGLTVTRHLIEAHGATITAADNDAAGSGACFTVVWPLDRSG